METDVTCPPLISRFSITSNVPLSLLTARLKLSISTPFSSVKRREICGRGGMGTYRIWVSLRSTHSWILGGSRSELSISREKSIAPLSRRRQCPTVAFLNLNLSPNSKGGLSVSLNPTHWRCNEHFDSEVVKNQKLVNHSHSWIPRRMECNSFSAFRSSKCSLSRKKISQSLTSDWSPLPEIWFFRPDIHMCRTFAAVGTLQCRKLYISVWTDIGFKGQ